MISLKTIKLGLSKDFFINSYRSGGINYFQYFLKYLIEIGKLTVNSLIIFKKDTSISTIFFVDLLPDTHFPVLIISIYAKLLNRKIKVIADIEENIESVFKQEIYKNIDFLEEKNIDDESLVIHIRSGDIFSLPIKNYYQKVGQK